MKAFYRFAQDAKVLRQKAEERERKRLEAERRRREWEAQRQEKHREIRREEERLAALIAEVDAWQQSERLRAYVETVRKAAIAKSGEIIADGEVAQWIRWALGYADRFDPLRQGPSSILDEKKKWEHESWHH